MKDLLEPRRIFVVIIAIGLLAMCLRPMTDPDVWWHLRTGQLILQSHHVFHHDPYSVTLAGHTWINHEWLFDVLLFSSYRITGASGLMVLFAVITAGAFFLVYFRSAGRPYIAGTVTVVAAVASIPTFGVRPQMLSLLLTAAFLCILRMRQERPSALWWLVLIMAFWVNVHAGYAVGPALIFVVLAGEVLDAAIGRKTWATARIQIRRLALLLLSCLAIVPLNPNGSRLYAYPWQTLTSKSMQTYIQEWFSPNFHQAEYVPFLVLILALFCLAGFSERRLLPGEFLLLGATLFAGLRSVRHVPIFALVAIPIFSSLIEEMPGLRWARSRTTSRASAGFPLRRIANAVILLAFGVFGFVRFHSVLGSQATAEAQKFPTSAVSWIAAHHPVAPILNHYNWGGYLIWKLYPEYHVFIDGRADLYGDVFMDDTASVYYLKDGWKKIFEAWHVQTVVLPPDAPLSTFLSSDTRWNVVYRDQQAIIFSLNLAHGNVSQPRHGSEISGSVPKG